MTLRKTIKYKDHIINAEIGKRDNCLYYQVYREDEGLCPWMDVVVESGDVDKTVYQLTACVDAREEVKQKRDIKLDVTVGNDPEHPTVLISRHEYGVLLHINRHMYDKLKDMTTKR